MDDSIRNLFNQLTLDTEREAINDVNDSNVNQILKHLPTLVSEFNSNNPDSVYKSTIIFRKLLSVEIKPPIDEIVKTGIVPRLVQLLSPHELPKLQFEAAWVLTNIASGTLEHTRLVLEHGGAQAFVSLLNSTDDDVKEQSIMALGNIAGESESRNFLLNLGALQSIVNVLEGYQSLKLSIIRNTCWAISNFCRGKPQPSIKAILPALMALSKLLYCNDDEVLTDACWAFSYLTDDPSEGSNERIQEVINVNICRRLVELLGHESVAIQTPALRAIGNIVSGEDSQTLIVLNCGVLARLAVLLKSPKKVIRKEASWTISNITACGTSQIQQVINDKNIIPTLLGLLAGSDPDVKREATCAISNVLSYGTPEHVKYLVNEQGCIKSLCNLLEESGAGSSPVIGFAMDGILGILKAGELESDYAGINPYTRLFEEVGAIDNFSNLQTHPGVEIYKKSSEILDYFIDKE